jgi:hypothetical protein
MMKKILSKSILGVLSLLLCLLAVSGTEAAPYVNDSVLSAYSETFLPAAEGSALVKIDAKAISSSDGAVYLPINFKGDKKDSKNKLTVKKMLVNNEAAKFTEVKIGETAFFRIESSKTSPVTIKAELVYPAFFKTKNASTETGVPEKNLTYNFINTTNRKIGGYTVKIVFPKGMEPMSIVSPKNAVTYKLGEQDGSRTFYYQVKRGLAPSASVGINMTFGKPYSDSMVFLAILWISIGAISAYVLYKRCGRGAVNV